MKHALVFLALALPPLSHDKQYAKLVEMMKRDFPTMEVILVHKDERVIGELYLHTPFYFKELRVYLQRHSPYKDAEWLAKLKDEILVERVILRRAA